MLRALNKHRNPSRYGRLDKEPDTECLLEGELKTSGSSPSHEVSGSPKLCTLGPELAPQNVSPVNPRRRKGSKSHPLFSLCDGAGRKKNTTARPEFARYLQYVKEGGVWV
ncbi:PROTEIN SHROOM-LIKE [Salix purpurea]|uniref:PROTEIN SHROOM-LIKE n=1 Tax=Salix purpurea TaxID=77065 RepID=A0A9Q0ZMH0_SALPP|nr:PROTEIN SHROOM-LIKE [Salix purpurea]